MTSLPVVTVIIPHLSKVDGKNLGHRDEGLRRCIDSIKAQTYPQDRIEVVVLDGPESVPEKVEIGLRQSKGDFVVFAANDMELAPDALEAAHKDSVEFNKALVAFNGGALLPDEGNICEHFMIRKDFVKELENGQIFSTDFHHVGCDNWLWAQAKRRNEAFRSERAKMTHHHFSKSRNAMDAVYKRGWDKVDQDRQTLRRKLTRMEKKLKIAVYTITKNEEKFIRRYCETSKLADQTIIIDTGSTDKTIEIARECGAIVHKICVSPWRFDVARTAALALLDGDVDVCVSLDADEILTEGWREEIERLWTDKTTRLQYLYDWGHNIRFLCDKIHARKGYLWKYPCHEWLVPDGRFEQNTAVSDKLLVVHLPDDAKSRGQYLDLLALGAKENPTVPRHSFYYARELTFHNKHEDAIKELKRYLTLPEATWKEERSFSMRLLGKSYAALGRSEEAIEWYVKSTEEAPHRKEPWLDLATFCYNNSLWDKCFEASVRCIETPPSTQWPVDSEVNGPHAFDMAAIAAYHLGNRTLAVKYGAVALEMSPNDTRLAKNMKWYSGELK